MLRLNLIHGGLSRRMSRPITGIVSRGVSRAYPLILVPLVCLLAALLFPIPTGDFAPDCQHLTLIALPPGSQSVDFTTRVLVRLEKAEAIETDPWLRDDIRIAWIATFYASQGNPQPHIDATYRVLGLHPDKVWPAICARRAALLGSFADVGPIKKPCQGTKQERRRAA